MPRTGSSQRAVAGGAVDSTHTGVVAVLFEPAGIVSDICTGVVIAPRVVATAAHCVYGRTPADLRVVVGESIATPDQTLPVASTIVYPRFGGPSADPRQANDLAALLLPADAMAAPIAYDRAGNDVSPARLVGYGLFDPDARSSSGTRRAADVATTPACDRLISLGTTVSACVGDSGGPLLVSDAAGERALGIISFGSTDGPCGIPVYALPLAPFQHWLDTIVAGAPDLQCATTCPPNETTCNPGPAPSPSSGGCAVVF